MAEPTPDVPAPDAPALAAAGPEAPAPGTTVDAGGWTFGLHRRGDGAPLVLLHGLLTDSRVWQPLAAGLPGRTTLAFDAPGHGLAPARTAPHTLEEEVDRLADAYRAVMGERPAVWAGHSMGGMKTWRMALRHPGLVAGLVQIDTRPDPEPDSTRAPFEAMVEAVKADGMTPDLAAMVARLNFRRSFLTTPAARHWVDHFTTLTGERIEHACHAVYRRGDITGQLPGLDVPVLVVHGADDVPIRLPVVRATTALMPRARLTVLPATGHTPPVERPAELLAAVREFLTDPAVQERT
ncbi:alpha/beta fold hydrolase [Kitasatospora sp. NPDC056327]|uniref:alpha/beta fold hydrolase n=1 Tax=Kitasatospora sp. NPDC056327 TaxID=3345785 RepID=UPI0035E18D09